MRGISLLFQGGQQPAYYIDQFNREGNTITVAGSGAYAGHVMYWEEPIFVGDAFSVKTDETILSTKYVYHFLLQNQQKIYAMKKGSGVPHVYPKDLGVLQIPLPPLFVQGEIVRILDKFTDLEQELERELKKELEIRKKQYEYYRDKLLIFNDIVGGSTVVWKMLEEVFEIITGGDVPKEALSETETKEYNIPILSNGINEKAIGWTSYRDRPFFPIVRLLVLIPQIEINLKYAYYFMKSIENNYKVAKVGIPQLTKPMIKNISIPLPPIAEQERIVAILDKFDTLVNSISEGLPREIALRRKQYEYYRERLMTFPES